MRSVVWIGSVAACVSCGPALDGSEGGDGTEEDGGSATAGAETATTSSSGAQDGGTIVTSASTAADTSSTSDTSTTGVSTGTTTGSSATEEGTDGAETSTGEVPMHCCNVPRMQNADISGTTPLGQLELGWAWYSWAGGECGGHRLYVFESPDLLAPSGWEDATLSVWFTNGWLEWQGTGPASVTVRKDGMEEYVDADVTIVALDPYPDPPWCREPGTIAPGAEATITLDIQVPGWDLAGTVVAPYCPSLNVFCP